MTKKLSESSLLLTQEELQKHILGMTLFNDLLARAVLEDKEACEHILRILTGIKTLVIKKNKTHLAINLVEDHAINLVKRKNPVLPAKNQEMANREKYLWIKSQKVQKN